MSWLFLFLAILLEIGGTTLLKLSNGWTRLWPTLGMVASYAACFYFLSLALRKIELGVAYAVWSAVGIAALSLIGLLIFKESLGWLKVASLALIIAGVVGLNLSGGAH